MTFSNEDDSTITSDEDSPGEIFVIMISGEPNDYGFQVYHNVIKKSFKKVLKMFFFFNVF